MFGLYGDGGGGGGGGVGATGILGRALGVGGCAQGLSSCLDLYFSRSSSEGEGGVGTLVVSLGACFLMVCFGTLRAAKSTRFLVRVRGERPPNNREGSARVGLRMRR